MIVNDCSACQKQRDIESDYLEILWDHTFLSDVIGCWKNSGIGLHKFHCNEMQYFVCINEQ
jgi:hypothetical protein